MGLPRYLEDKYKKIINKPESFDYIFWYNLGQTRFDRAEYKETTQNNIFKFKLKSLYYGHKSSNYGLSVITGNNETSWGLRTEWYNRNMFEKVDTTFYTHVQKYGNEWKMVYCEIPVNRYFSETATEKSHAKIKKEYDIQIKKEELDNIKQMEQGRLFKGRLRQMIFERDNYKCVLCGRSADDGIKIEVDHIQPWEDGGKTKYDNGRTVCNECNKGLHHFKKYKEKENKFAEVIQ